MIRRPARRAGVQHDVERAYREHATTILGYLARRVDPVDDAADLLSEVMLTAWRRRDAMPPPPQDLLWLYGVARHVLANHRRSTRRRTARVQALADELRAAAAQPPDVRAEVLDVRAAIQAMPEPDREILLLSDWEGLNSTEIGVLLEMPASTVRARLVRARDHVRARAGTQAPA